MKIPNIKGAFTVGKAVVLAHRPELLFGASVVGTVAAAVLGAKGGYEARGIVDEAQRKRNEGTIPVLEPVPLTVKEKAALTWKCYLPAAMATLGAVGATTGLHLVHVKEKKAIAAAALMAIDEIRNEANDWVEEVKEIVADPDKKPAEKVKALNETLADSDGVVSERILIRDPITGRDIFSNKVMIEEAMVEIGNQMNASSCASLNNFYENAGWGRLPIGDDLGWEGVIPAVSWKDQFGRDISGVRDDGRPYRSFRFLPDPAKDWDVNG